MIDGIPVVNIGAGGLVTLFVVMFFTGRIVARKAVDDLIRLLEKSEERGENYRKANEVLMDQNSKLIHNADLSQALLESIKRKAEGAP